MIVETGCGRIRGVREDGLFKFRGVPYAAAPIGPLRFRPPQAPQPWTGVLDATSFGPAPPQVSNDPLPLPNDITDWSEDCLRLNIYTPALDGKRPVVVWLHGGAFVRGTASRPTYDRGVLSLHGDLVFVSVEYRLGALGFLYLDGIRDGHGAVTANLGIRDQIHALEWIRREIASFGGDPDNITLAGHSAGAVCVGTLITAAATRGKFRRAILQSGPPTAIDSEAATSVATTFLEGLGLGPKDAERLLDIPVDVLLRAQLATWRSPGRRPLNVPFAPVIDGDLLERHPMETLRERPAGSALIAGTTDDEMTGYLILQPDLLSLDEEGLRRLCANIVDTASTDAVDHIISTYRQARARRGARVTPCDLWLAIQADRFVRYGTTKAIELQSTHQCNAYAYRFTRRSPFMNGTLGAFHELELAFLFGYYDEPVGRTFTGEDPERHDLAARLQSSWTAFASNGDPAHADFAWPRYERQRRSTMSFDTVCQRNDAPMEEERRVWEDLLPINKV